MTARLNASTWGCAGCRRRWTGVERAHCSACHQLYNTARLFDRHRHGGVCGIPPGQRLVGGVWHGRPTPAGEARHRAFNQRTA